jgi:methylase of polypeptide subunit release factors
MPPAPGAALGRREALQMSRLLLTEVLGVGFGAVLAGKTAEASPVQMDRLEQALMRLEAGEPLQYVLGRVHFMDLELRVDRRNYRNPEPQRVGGCEGGEGSRN